MRSWFENTELIGVFSRAREDVVNTQPLPVAENTKKGNSAIKYVSIDADEAQPDHALFEPTELATGGEDVWTEARQAVSARRVAYTFLSYGLASEQQNGHSGLADQGAGCGYYARANVRGHIERVVRENTAAAHEKDANRMLLFVNRTWNPLVEQPDLLQSGEFAAEFRRLLRQRLEGDTQLPWLCNLAIRGAVAGFPGA